MIPGLFSAVVIWRSWAMAGDQVDTGRAVGDCDAKDRAAQESQSRVEQAKVIVIRGKRGCHPAQAAVVVVMVPCTV